MTVLKPRALIAYIDQKNPTRTPVVVPCRFARIIGATKHGTTVSLTLRIEGFALAVDLAATNASMRQLANGVPDYRDEKLSGYWWTDMSDLPAGIEERKDLGAWELIIDQLYAHDDFARDELFYIVTGIFRAEAGLIDGSDPDISDHFVKSDGGRLLMNGGGDYEIQVYHYHPKTAPTTPMWFAVESTSPMVKFSTATRAPIDSPYDLKKFRFRTEVSLNDELPVISVRSEDSGAQSANAFGLDLLTKIAGQKWRFAGYGALVGLLLGFPPTAAALANSGLSDSAKVLVAIISLVGGLIAGEIAAFGLRKL